MQKEVQVYVNMDGESGGAQQRTQRLTCQEV